MQIIIVGCGNVGSRLIEQLSQEGHNITAIDLNSNKVEKVVNDYDVMGLVGNGASHSVQKQAGIEDADLLIAVTTADELNLLCCLIAKKAGDCHTIARVRNPIYTQDEVSFIKEELGLSMIINPEMAASQEIARIIQFPSAIRVETFAKGRLELLNYKITDQSILVGCRLADIASRLRCEVLVCAVEREGCDVIIPDGQFVLEENDVIYFVAQPRKAGEFLKKAGVGKGRVRNVMIVGGGETSFYLAKQLLAMGIDVKIIERDKTRCSELSELLPQALVICGDGTDRDLLMEESLEKMQVFVAWTSFDEENIMLSLYVKKVTNVKTITKVHRMEHNEILKSLDLGSVFFPKNITAEHITQYVRAMDNSIGCNIETLYQLVDDKIEALEFAVKDSFPYLNVPVQDMNLKPNLLLCSINHKGKIIIPRGQDVIQKGDTVVVVTANKGLYDIRDIFQ